jgi:hypothetical protein
MRRQLRVGFLAFLITATTAYPAQNPKADQPEESQPKDSKAKDDKSKDKKSKDKKSNEKKFLVRGKVVDRDGSNVSNAVVTIAGPRAPITTTTDSAGSYSFEGPAGKYTVTAKAGAKTGSLSDDVAASKELRSLKIE